MLNLRQIMATKLNTSPFEWAVIYEAFSPKIYSELLAKFPTSGFHLTERIDSGTLKAYRSYNLTVLDDGVPTVEFAELAPVWQDAVQQIASRRVADVLHNLTGRRMDDTRLEVRFVVYEPGCWISPHLDRADKRLTQVFYFQSADEYLEGGELLILGSNDMEAIVARVAPNPNSMALLLPSERSWHAVSPVGIASLAPRRCLLVHHKEGRR